MLPAALQDRPQINTDEHGSEKTKAQKLVLTFIFSGSVFIRVDLWLFPA
jgi:hypothetical protein